MSDDSDISLLQLLRILLRGWRSLVIATTIGVLAGIFANHFTTRDYVATAFVAPVSSSGSQPNVSGGISAVASLAGINLHSGGGEDLFNEFQILLGSPIFAAQIDNRHGYLKRLFPSLWDPNTHRMIAPHRGWFSLLLREIVGANTKAEPPGPEQLAQLLKSQVVIDKIEGTSYYTFSYANADPELAKGLLRNVIDDANAEIKARQISEEESSANYLQRRLIGENSVEMRMALTGLITSEEQKLMMLNSDAPSAARVIDGVSVTTMPSTPSVARVFIVPFVVFFIVGIVLAFVEGRLRMLGKFEALEQYLGEIENRVRRWRTRPAGAQ